MRSSSAVWAFPHNRLMNQNLRFLELFSQGYCSLSSWLLHFPHHLAHFHYSLDRKQSSSPQDDLQSALCGERDSLRQRQVLIVPQPLASTFAGCPETAERTQHAWGQSYLGFQPPRAQGVVVFVRLAIEVFSFIYSIIFLCVPNVALILCVFFLVFASTPGAFSSFLLLCRLAVCCSLLAIFFRYSNFFITFLCTSYVNNLLF
jgi:hypothetical protein